MQKIYSKVVFIIGILALALTGCGAPSDDLISGLSPENANTENKDNNDTFAWNAAYSELNTCYTLALTTDSAIYGCYLQANQVLIDRVNKVDLSERVTFALTGVSYVSGMTADQEGNVYVLTGEEENAAIWKLSADGSFHDFLDLEFEDLEKADDFYLKGIFADSDGHFYVWCEMILPEMEMIDGFETEVWHYASRVYVKDAQMETIFYDEIAEMNGTEVLNFSVGTDNTPRYLIEDADGVSMQELDLTKKGHTDALRIDSLTEAFGENSENIPEGIVSTEDGILYCQSNNLCEYRYDTQETEIIFNFSTYGLSTSDILFMTKNGEQYEIIENHEGTEHSELVMLSYGVSEKQTVTLGIVTASQDLEDVIAEFNRYSSEYQVILKDYAGQEEDDEAALEQLKLDLVTGEAPDVIAVSGLDYQLFSNKGALADLYTFMENDADLSAADLVQSVTAAFEDDGRLYSAAPAFQLHSMWGYEDVTGGQSGVSFEELFALLEESGKDLNAITGFSADEPVLTRLCTVAMDEFVDWENGSCTFDGEKFKEVLSFAKEYTGNYTGGTLSERIRNREVVLSVGIISSVADYQIQEELYGGEVSFLGYPTTDGSGTAIAWRGSPLAINANSGNTQAAWEFVKFYLLNGYGGQGFPMVREQFDQALEAAQTDDYLASEDGGQERVPKGSYNDGSDNALYVYAATAEEAATVRELVENAENRFETHITIQNIINEEAEGYFSDQVDLDHTAEKIQSRVKLLLEENQ